ncbi:EboA domain-containing protein [Neolewinella antarctica]|uniref:Uncharacterized protein n=1 Tax=Neolewinella antarctica TaxID=442734 RepID=A0ABX0XGG8_9BACT|nr:EboA domain-containing protein [Neolewinella antarctica]NJC27973.1 hypothetical protein [Neolewinella antarctica]
MTVKDNFASLETILVDSTDEAFLAWFRAKIESIIGQESVRELYLTYSLLANKIGGERGAVFSGSGNATEYLKTQLATPLEVARIYLLSTVLRANDEFFQPKVANLIEVSDTSELVTLLRFLSLLPNPATFSATAVEALRTNITTVFEAISLDNPYPADHFNDEQWNQLYLKAAFMQLDLSRILRVEERANEKLARIVSDFAHERWAAGRTVDPLFWRPVTNFVDAARLNDVRRLLTSEDPTERRAGALCCFHSGSDQAKESLKNNPELSDQLTSGALTWKTLKAKT